MMHAAGITQTRGEALITEPLVWTRLTILAFSDKQKGASGLAEERDKSENETDPPHH